MSTRVDCACACACAVCPVLSRCPLLSADAVHSSALAEIVINTRTKAVEQVKRFEHIGATERCATNDHYCGELHPRFAYLMLRGKEEMYSGFAKFDLQEEQVSQLYPNLASSPNPDRTLTRGSTRTYTCGDTRWFTPSHTGRRALAARRSSSRAPVQQTRMTDG